MKPLLVAGLAVAGLLLYRRATPAPVKGASSRTTADYYNPVDVAASFVRLAIAVTKAIPTTQPSSLSMVQANAPGISDAGLDGFKKFGGPSTGSLWDWTAGGLGDPFGSWSTPSLSRVNDTSLSRYTVATDQLVAAPVYDPGQDVAANRSPYEGIAAGQW